MYRAVLDTCALAPAGQRDFLLQLAAEGAYTPLWGTGILVELAYVTERLDERRGSLDGSDARRRHLFGRMHKAFPESTLEAPKDGDYAAYGLLDPDDGHVAHVAVLGHADAIVTDDTRAGFRTSDALRAAGVAVLYPYEFAAEMASMDPDAGERALRALSARQVHPPRTPNEILDDLVRKYAMTDAAMVLRPRLADADLGGATPAEDR